MYTGQLIVHCNYGDDKLEGEYRSWYYDGEPHKHCNYKDNKLHGKYMEWNDDGVTVSYHSDGTKLATPT
jgi:antitoxin component YwqK of YwqJK toxin-antitoxin module